MRRAWSSSSCCWWATSTAACATNMTASAAPTARRRCGLRHASFRLPTSFLTLCDDKEQRARAPQRRTSTSSVLPGATGPPTSANHCGEGMKHVTGAAQAGVRNHVHLLRAPLRRAEKPEMGHGLRRLLSGHHRYECDGPGTAPNDRSTIPRRATGTSGTLGGAAPRPGAVHNSDCTIRPRAKGEYPPVHAAGGGQCGRGSNLEPALAERQHPSRPSRLSRPARSYRPCRPSRSCRPCLAGR